MKIFQFLFMSEIRIFMDINEIFLTPLLMGALGAVVLLTHVPIKRTRVYCISKSSKFTISVRKHSAGTREWCRLLEKKVVIRHRQWKRLMSVNNGHINAVYFVNENVGWIRRGVVLNITSNRYDRHLRMCSSKLGYFVIYR